MAAAFPHLDSAGLESAAVVALICRLLLGQSRAQTPPCTRADGLTGVRRVGNETHTSDCHMAVYRAQPACSPAELYRGLREAAIVIVRQCIHQRRCTLLYVYVPPLLLSTISIRLWRAWRLLRSPVPVKQRRIRRGHRAGHAWTEMQRPTG